MLQRSEFSRVLLRLWSRLTLTAAAAGLLFLLFYTLEHIDGWIVYSSTAEIVADTAVRVLAVLVLASVFGGVGATLTLIFAGREPGKLQRRADALVNAVVAIAALLCSLVVWRTAFMWADIVKLVTVPFAAKYSIWLLAAALGGVTLWRRRSQSLRRLEAGFAGTTTRRAVIAAGLGAAVVSVARPGLPLRSTVGAVLPRSQRRNIILVTFDALSAEDMSLYGYHLPTTPNIDAFARTSSVFDNFYSCSTFTTSSVASMLTGRYPLNTRVFHPWGHLRAENRDKTLLNELRAAGYRTAASVSNVLAYPPRLGVEFDIAPTPPVKGVIAAPPVLMDDALFLQNHERIILEYRMPKLFGTTQSRFPPELCFAQAEALLGLLTPPFFLWVHVMAPHDPYQPSPPFLNRFVGGGDMRMISEIGPLLYESSRQYNLRDQPTFDRWRLRYDEWIAQTDAAFGQFQSRLESRGTLSNTAVIVSADHGESFQGGTWGHASRTQLRQVVHVPLILRLPSQADGQRIVLVADQTALAPTILGVAGVPTPEWMDGKSLMPAINSAATNDVNGIAFTQFFQTDSVFKPVRHGTVGAINGKHQYVFDLESGKGSLYELAHANSQDNDIAASEPHIAASMREMILSRFPELRRGAA